MSKKKKKRKDKSAGNGQPQFRYSEKQVLEAVLTCKGYIKKVAKALAKVDDTNPSWHTAKRHIENWESTKEAYADQRELHIDSAEKTLNNAVTEKDVGAAMFVLKTRGKDRGYTEKQIIEHEGDGAITINIMSHEADV